MSFIKEIHEQPEWLRTLLFGLTCIIVIAFAGFLTLSTLERGVILTSDPYDGPERLAERQQQRPDPMRTVRNGVNSAVANIGDLIGFDRSAGFDIEPQNGDNRVRTYLLPLSE